MPTLGAAGHLFCILSAVGSDGDKPHPRCCGIFTSILVRCCEDGDKPRPNGGCVQHINYQYIANVTISSQTHCQHDSIAGCGKTELEAVQNQGGRTAVARSMSRMEIGGLRSYFRVGILNSVTLLMLFFPCRTARANFALPSARRLSALTKAV